MKKCLCLLILSVMLVPGAFASGVSPDCTYNGTPLHGRVKVVNSFEDFRVKKVSSFEDLRVKDVDSFANSCGRWQFVDSFEDFTIRYVDSFEDFRIKFVESFEGVM